MQVPAHHEVTWTNPITYCGPGTTFNGKKCISVNLHDDPLHKSCKPGQAVLDGVCVDVNVSTKTCAPFESGKFYDAPPHSVHEFVQAPHECAARCYDDKSSTHFVHSTNMKTCACLSMKDVVEPKQEDVKSFPKCAVDEKDRHITLTCGEHLTIFDATRHNAKAFKNLRSSVCSSKDPRSPSRLSCNDSRQGFTRGETCNFDMNAHCGQGTTLKDGKCVVVHHSLTRKYSRIPRGRCIASDSDLYVHNSEAQDIRIATVQADSDTHCMSLCDETTPCHAAVYDSVQKTCDLVPHCLKITETGAETSTLLTKKMPVAPKVPKPSEHCGDNTLFDGSKCIGTAGPEFCGKNSKLVGGKCIGHDPPGPQVCRPGTRWLKDSKQCARDLSQGKIFCGKGTIFDGIQCTPHDTSSATDSLKLLKQQLANTKEKAELSATAHKTLQQALDTKTNELSTMTQSLNDTKRAQAKAMKEKDDDRNKQLLSANNRVAAKEKELQDITTRHATELENLRKLQKSDCDRRIQAVTARVRTNLNNATTLN